MSSPVEKFCKPKWSRRKEARPQELLAAALGLFIERGFAATRLEDVAKQAGVSKGTLYLYFDNKEELFKTVVRESMLPVLGEAEGIVENYDGDSATLFREIILRWWEKIGDTPLSGLPKLMMAECGNFPEVAKFYYDEVISRANTLFIKMIERGIRRGEFRKMDPEQAMNVMVAPIMMLMLWKHSFHFCRPEPISAPHYLDCFIDLFLNGLLIDKPAPASSNHVTIS